MKFNVFNAYAVSAARGGEGVRIFSPPTPREVLSPDEALLLAAWLVAIADPGGERFTAILDAVRNA